MLADHGEPGGALRIEVADTGPGIETSSRARLFRDFERLDAPASIEGAGLGLAISARFVGLMGGAIGHVANPTGGSIFWLELPSAEPTLSGLSGDDTASSNGHFVAACCSSTISR